MVARSASVARPVVGTPTGGSPTQWTWPSRSVRVAAARGADDRPARPDAAVLGGLEEEGAGPVAGELAVDADRGLGVAHEAAHDGDDAAVAGEHAEDVEGGPGLAVGQVGAWSPRRMPCSRGRLRLTDDGAEVVGVEAGAVAGVAGRADLVDAHEQGVAVAVERDRAHVLDVAGGVALAPVLAAGCATSRSPGPR